jgi:hypothetical protein
MKKERFFTHQPSIDKILNPNVATCRILDRETIEPIPETPSCKRFKIVKSGMKFTDAVEECKKLNNSTK